MDTLAYELKERFTGFWNTTLLIALVVICLRFSGAEWKGERLETRLLYSFYLLLSVVGFGVLLAAIRSLLAKLESRPYGNPYPEAIASGLKYGITSGTVVVFVIGVLMVDNYLGPIKDILDLALLKIKG